MKTESPDNQFLILSELLTLLGPENLLSNPGASNLVLETLLNREQEHGMDWMHKNLDGLRHEVMVLNEFFGP
jgi:hypothetical protein